MSKIKVMSILELTQAIKMAPLVKELESRKEVESIVCCSLHNMNVRSSTRNILN